MLEYNIGKGNKARFWSEIWLDDQPLKQRYNRSFMLES